MNLWSFPMEYKKYAAMAENKNPGLQGVQYSVANPLTNPDVYVYLGNMQDTYNMQYAVQFKILSRIPT